MSLYSTGKAAEAPLVGVEVLEATPGLTVPEFREYVASLSVPSYTAINGTRTYGHPARLLGNVISMSRTPETPREPWAPDHHWHSDRTYWGENQFATVLYAQALVGKVATTELLDTATLLHIIERDVPGITDELLPGETVFSVGRYYHDILPLKGSNEAINRTLTTKGAKSLKEVVATEEQKYPPKRFPTLAPHPFRSAYALMVDSVRAVRFTAVSSERSRELLAMINRRYLDLPPEELTDRPYYHSHEWQEGQVLIFPQIGTLHRAGASPVDEQRRDTLRLFIQ